MGLNLANEKLNDLSYEKLKHQKVCEKHFTAECFTSNERKRLTPTATPTLLSIEEEFEICPERQEDNVSTTGESSSTVSSHVRVSPLNTSNCIRYETSTTPQINRSKRALFNSPDVTNNNNSFHDPDTPMYKKYKSVKGRKCTPRKSITPKEVHLHKQLKKVLKDRKSYKQQLVRLKSKAKNISTHQVTDHIKQILPQQVYNFFKMQISHCGKTNKKWTSEERRQALGFRYRSPALYEQMRSQGFALPCRSTLTRWLEKIDIHPGVSGELFYHIQRKVETMNIWEKQTVVMFDGMSIKRCLEYNSKRDSVEGVQDLGSLGRGSSPGTEVLVFMVRGLLHRWKLPVAYYVVNKCVKGADVKVIILDCLSTLLKTGLKIKAVVCDQGSTNRKAASLLKVTKDLPYFICDENKIFFIYDFLTS